MLYRQLLVGSDADPTLLLLPDAGIPSDLLRDPQAYIAPAAPGQTAGLVTTSAPSLPRFAQLGSSPVQGDNLLNDGQASQPGQPLVVVLQGTGGARVHLRSILARCSAGVSALSVQDGTRNLFPAGLVTIGAALISLYWGTALAAAEGNALTVTFGAAGVGNIIYASIQADRI